MNGWNAHKNLKGTRGDFGLKNYKLYLLYSIIFESIILLEDRPLKDEPECLQGAFSTEFKSPVRESDTTHPLLVLWLRISREIPPRPRTPPWRSYGILQLLTPPRKGHSCVVTSWVIISSYRLRLRWNSVTAVHGFVLIRTSAYSGNDIFRDDLFFSHNFT
jgi:hypothetical protein